FIESNIERQRVARYIHLAADLGRSPLVKQAIYKRLATMDATIHKSHVSTLVSYVEIHRPIGSALEAHHVFADYLLVGHNYVRLRMAPSLGVFDGAVRVKLKLVFDADYVIARGIEWLIDHGVDRVWINANAAAANPV